jgi:hypothetical protein
MASENEVHDVIIYLMKIIDSVTHPRHIYLEKVEGKASSDVRHAGSPAVPLCFGSKASYRSPVTQS